MPEVQAKFEEGFNTVKGGIQQGKKKLQNMQETAELKRQIKEASQQKTKIYLELGKQVYRMIREGRIQNEELLQTVQPLTAQDKIIYEALKVIKELNTPLPGGVKCGCGTFLPKDQPFCTACGRKNAELESITVQLKTSCASCEAEIPQEAAYCPCCGAAAHFKSREGC
ncbi:zinc ribbon domain-containing protein [Paenibacillus rhizophilus]|uniref:Zinc ribbon domain-containing protein n=1 Tax=Paenibacillus rhizophilus TaxID=1850366 RepID=A0A3N9P4H8_9BACL|nr:zinc ribbon domain-containing protein [Paenibacillus rhizophilus]RQW10659.1 zinc ribbon domain-containing protein [Paenibacillus rhizophilus]